MEFNLDDYSSYTIIEISNICEMNQKSYCQHYVTIKFNNEEEIKGILSGEIIAKYFKYHNMTVPLHYLDFVSSRYGFN
jgi:hypothetical protein